MPATIRPVRLQTPPPSFYTKHIIGTVFYLAIGIFFMYMYTWDIEYKEYENSTISEAVYLLRTYKRCYFTVWNFFFQICFMLICIADTLGVIWNINYFVQDTIYQLRCYVFNGIVFPLTGLTVTAFWGTYWYDKTLIFPEEVFEMIPDVVIHTLHTAIIVPVLIELALPKFYSKLEKRDCFDILSLVVWIYCAMCVLFYWLEGAWLYPVFNEISFTEKYVLAITALAVAAVYMCIGVTIQNLKVPKTRRPQKATKAAKKRRRRR